MAVWENSERQLERVRAHGVNRKNRTLQRTSRRVSDDRSLYGRAMGQLKRGRERRQSASVEGVKEKWDCMVVGGLGKLVEGKVGGHGGEEIQRKILEFL